MESHGITLLLLASFTQYSYLGFSIFFFLAGQHPTVWINHCVSIQLLMDIWAISTFWPGQNCHKYLCTLLNGHMLPFLSGEWLGMGWLGFIVKCVLTFVRNRELTSQHGCTTCIPDRKQEGLSSSQLHPHLLSHPFRARHSGRCVCSGV